jgi:hypothetical protein
MVLRRIFGPKREGVTRGWRKLHNLYYSTPDIIRMITSKSIRWARHVTRVGKMRNAYNILVGKPKGKRPLWRSSHDERIILKGILEKWTMSVWIGFA